MTGFNRHILNLFIWFVTTAFASLSFLPAVMAKDDMVGSFLNIKKPEVFSFAKKAKTKITNFQDFSRTSQIANNNYIVSSAKANDIEKNTADLSNTLDRNSALRRKIANLKTQLSIKDSARKTSKKKRNTFQDYSDDIVATDANDKDLFKDYSEEDFSQNHNQFQDYSDEDLSVESDNNQFQDYSNEEISEERPNPFQDYSEDEFVKEDSNPVSLEDVFSKMALKKSGNTPKRKQAKKEQLSFQTENSFFNKPLPSYKDTYLDMGSKKPTTKFNVKGELNRSFLSQNKYIAPLEISSQDNNDWDDDKDDFKSAKSQRARSENILQLKIKFKPNSSAISSHNLNILRAFAHTVLDKPYQGIQISISEDVMRNKLDKVLAAKQFAITSKILREEGINEEQIIPVLTDRSLGSLALNIVSTDSFKAKSVSSGTDIFGQEKDLRSFRLMNW